MSESGWRRRIIFFLAENYELSLQHGLIGHEKTVPDEPMLLPGDNEFLAAVSMKGVIFGPFRQTKRQFYNDTPLGFIRLDPLSRAPMPAICPYRFAFGQAEPEVPIEYGLDWKEAARILGVNAKHWDEIRRLEFTDQQYNRLRYVLIAINDGTLNSVEKVLLESTTSTSQENEDFDPYEFSEEFFAEIYGGGDLGTAYANYPGGGD